MFSLFGRAIVVAATTLAAVHSANAQQGKYPRSATLEEIRQRVDELPQRHPRLFTTQNELADLAVSLDRDPLRRQLADWVVREAIALDDVEPVERKLEGRRLLHESRRCLQRVLILSMSYHLTGDSRHVDRCQQEMLAAASYSDWNPSHFLDVAEMTFALAVGYDWLYDQLDEPTRQELREAIVEKGVQLAFDPQHNSWTRLANNWAQVCHGGLAAGALAVLEDEPDLAARTVHNALQNLDPAMNQYAPRGSYPEGPNYWGYGTTYNVLLIDALDNVFGSDFGLSNAPGFDQTGAYLALACGPTGQFFNYADGKAERRAQPALFWFAPRYRRPDWLWGERALWEKQLADPEASGGESQRFFPLALLWMDEATDPAEVRLPLHWNGGGGSSHRRPS